MFKKGCAAHVALIFLDVIAQGRLHPKRVKTKDAEMPAKQKLSPDSLIPLTSFRFSGHLTQVRGKERT
jgi:hypothetical protein